MDSGTALVISTAITNLTVVVAALINNRRTTTLAAKVDTVHDATNSMKDQLVETTRQAALAAGIAQGKAIEKARLDAEALADVRQGSKD